MKKFFFGLLFAVILHGISAAQISERHPHQNWDSMLLNPESGRAVGRAITLSESQTMALTLDFPAGHCAKPALGLLVISRGNSQARNISGTLQVNIDNRAPHILPATCTFLGEIATIYLGLDYDDAIINELKRGGQIETNFHAIGQPVIQAEFSLWGMGAAYSTAQNLCLAQPVPTNPMPDRTIAPYLDDDARYFPSPLTNTSGGITR